MKNICQVVTFGIIATAANAAMVLVNGNFEASPFDGNWTSTGTVTAVTGAQAIDTTSAKLATGATIFQRIADTPADELGNFEYTFSFRVGENDADTAVSTNTYRVRLRTLGNGDIVTLRFTPGSIGAYGADGWRPAVACTLQENTRYTVRVTGKDWDKPTASYTVAISTDNVNFTTGNPISAFHSNTPAKLGSVAFETGSTPGTELVIDNVKISRKP